LLVPSSFIKGVGLGSFNCMLVVMLAYIITL
jgi:hypothetical protein